MGVQQSGTAADHAWTPDIEYTKMYDVAVTHFLVKLGAGGGGEREEVKEEEVEEEWGYGCRLWLVLKMLLHTSWETRGLPATREWGNQLAAPTTTKQQSAEEEKVEEEEEEKEMEEERKEEYEEEEE